MHSRKGLMLILAILIPMAVNSFVFMAIMRYEGQFENADLVTAIYWVAETITTLGYGDIVFHGQIGRLFTIIVAFSGIAIFWAVILPLGLTPKIESLVRANPTSAPEKIKDHVIISGYSPMVEILTERLASLKIPFLIIERSENEAKNIYRSYPTIWGDPSADSVLLRAGINSARLFIANEREGLNADVILAVRDISDIEIIALVDDLEGSRFLAYAGASRIISPKMLLGKFLAQISAPPKKDVFPGAIELFDDLILAELPIYPGCKMIRNRLTLNSIQSTGVDVIGIWQKGVFLPDPGPADILKSNSVLMAVGKPDQVTKARNLTLGARRFGHLIILGYGDVGKQVAATLCEGGINPVIVDKQSLGDMPFEHIEGDATSEDILVKAGIKQAVGTLILLNDDSDAVYATLLAKNLNPDAFVAARANLAKSAEKIYRAGADYVASLPVVASHMLAKTIQQEEEELALLYEDLELKLLKVDKGSKLAGKTFEEIDLPGRFTCRAVATRHRETQIANPDKSMVMEPGDTIAIIGSPEGIEAFSNAYERKQALMPIRLFM